MHVRGKRSGEKKGNDLFFDKNEIRNANSSLKLRVEMNVLVFKKAIGPSWSTIMLNTLNFSLTAHLAKLLEFLLVRS